MSTVTVFVRLALLFGVLLLSPQGAGASYAAGLTLPGMRHQDTGDSVCRSFKICHNSKGAAWTTVQVFSAMEPLLNKLRLEPATDYVEVMPLQGCISSGCCCSSPVEVRISLPVHTDPKTAAAELSTMAEFMQYRLPRELKDTACTSGQLGDCPPVLAAERKLLSPEEDMATLPAGLLPYDGKRPAPEIEDDTLPPLPEGLVPYGGDKPQKPKPRSQPPKPKKPTADSSEDLPLPEGLVPYDHKTTRQLLEQLDESAEEAAIAAVPAMPGAGSSWGAAAVLESGSPGGYGGGGRSLLEVAGGYGGRALLQVGGYGSSAGRNLLEEPRAAKPAATPKPDQKKPSTPDSTKKPEKKTDTKKPEEKQPSADSSKNIGSTNPQPAPCSSNTSSSSTAPNGRPFGTCYCRYNPKTSSWALEQAACRASLFNRCKTAGTLLECPQVEAYYRGLSMPGSEPPHKDTLTAFLYTDCPPAPPCSCRALVSGSETPIAHSRCCADLQAHCQVPFSGLDCEDVARFCKPGRQSTDPVGALFSYVLVKTHGYDCSSPKYAVSYSSVVATSRSVAAERAVQQLSKAAMLEGVMASPDFSETDRVAALLTMLIGGCFAVAVAAVGVAVIFGLVSTRNHHSAPLLDRP